jgi:inosose dehydratase
LERSKLHANRIGAGPISWGVCEVPGWGVMLSADRVLNEMTSLGIHAIEIGAPGFLPDDPEALTAVLARHDVRLLGGFVPLVLHEPARRADALATARQTAALFQAAGASMFVSAAVVDAHWSPRRALSSAEWDHLFGMLAELDELCADHGLTHALHAHAGTLVETREDVRTVLDRSSVQWCLDTGHLLIGGYDPAAFAADAAGRVVHVHAKDVRASVAEQMRAGGLSLIGAVRAGLFCPLGTGDAPIAATVDQLEDDGYRGWYVLEQDTDLGGTEPDEGTGPVEDARVSVEFLRGVLVRQPAG